MTEAAHTAATQLALSLSMYLCLFAGDITQKGYEKKRSKLIRAYVPHAGGNLATSDPPALTHLTSLS